MTLDRLFPYPVTANRQSLSPEKVLSEREKLVDSQWGQPVCPLCHLPGTGTDPPGPAVTGGYPFRSRNRCGTGWWIRDCSPCMAGDRWHSDYRRRGTRSLYPDEDAGVRISCTVL